MRTELLRARDWAVGYFERQWQIRGLKRDIIDLVVGPKPEWVEGRWIYLSKDEVTPLDLPHLASSFPEFFQIKDMRVTFRPVYSRSFFAFLDHQRRHMQDPNSGNELALLFSTKDGSSRALWKTGFRIVEVEEELTRLRIVKEVVGTLRRREI